MLVQLIVVFHFCIPDTKAVCAIESGLDKFIFQLTWSPQDNLTNLTLIDKVEVIKWISDALVSTQQVLIYVFLI